MHRVDGVRQRVERRIAITVASMDLERDRRPVRSRRGPCCVAASHSSVDEVARIAIEVAGLT
jgi:hypothetical protein